MLQYSEEATTQNAGIHLFGQQCSKQATLTLHLNQTHIIKDCKGQRRKNIFNIHVKCSHWRPADIEYH